MTLVPEDTRRRARAYRIRPPSAPDADETPLDPVNSDWVAATLSSLSRRRCFGYAKTGTCQPAAGLLELEEDVAMVSHEPPAPTPPPPPPPPPEEAKAEEPPEKPRTVAGCPDPTEVIKLLSGGFEGLTPQDFERLKAIFNRYKDAGSADMHKDELGAVLKVMGYAFLDREKIEALADEITTYATLDFHEFTEFVEKFLGMEQKRFREVFDTFDDDGSGQLDTDELMHLMSSMGFTPLRAMVQEALDIVDEDKSGTISFQEFIHLLVVYRYSEGFTRIEVQQFWDVFQEVAKVDPKGNSEDKKVDVHDVKDLMLQFFGPQGAPLAEKISQEVIAGKPRRDGEKKTSPEDPLNFIEILICARRMREFGFEEYRKFFKEMDEDGSGCLDMGEIQKVIEKLGYTLCVSDLEEVCAEVEEDCNGKGGADENGQLDFDEFVHLMGIFKERDGFNKSELADLKELFERFDEDGSGEVETMELDEMMRHLGYKIDISETNRLLQSVDFNDSGSLDFREYLRFLRLFREEELQKWREIFKKSEDSGHPGFLHVGDLPRAVAEANEEECAEGHYPELSYDGPPLVDFDNFVRASHARRTARVQKFRAYAGFMEKDVEKYLAMFNSYDTDRSGSIEAVETSKLLNGLGITMTTAKERDAVMSKVEVARDAAKQVGVTDLGSGGTVSFQVLLQLLRILFMDRDKARLQRETDALAETKFTNLESSEFKQIFSACLKQDREYRAEAGEVIEAEDGPQFVPSVDAEAIRRLLGTLGLQVKGAQAVELTQKVSELTLSEGLVDFPDFMRLMRWMMNKNFCNINGATG
eukprot:TRINITY_DN121407_c0_g1_i1.p1 TRINITY_DN121407_c0_g1~~TRINITY_DN121407_c0_g1_i1.p1  ORF type:complete len:813 (-),score=240.83 TRINITY_DN121407_c0_g1_i1:234-2672(-)